ncbi:unnamed protein product [Phaedon cochleariae]|uniref:Sperm-tail PG-rich repeat-containing protein 2 n=1 Tax=Phaedon cochleariae TaxID=80249 RepID=A0A9P0DHU9_PHACE|nr:unnamed protein product [Phaedon cochleariae]
MYNNAPRMGIPLKSQTPPGIGPTTYIICDERSRLKNRVPFLSTEDKTPKFIAKTFCDTFYSVPESSNIKLGSSPRNKAPRFTYSGADSPGPGAYDPEPEPPLCPEGFKRPPSRGRLYVCRVPYTLKGCGPSVPTKINENGYLLNAEGDVVAIPPTEKEGAAFYDISEKPAYLDRYKGCKWSQRTSKRSFTNPKAGPGPADYDVRLPECARDVENDKFREMARLLTFLPRFLDAQDMKLRRENLPGPGQYNIRANQEPCKMCPGIFPRPFIRGSPRFKENILENPSPDAYDVAGSARIFRTSLAPFHVSASRFSKKKTARTPGPAEYDTNRPFSEKESAIFRAPFNNSALRNTIDLKKDAAITPSPAEYSIGNGNKCKILISSVFKSKVKRFPKRCNKLNEMSPAHYNPTDSFNYTKNRQSHNILALPFNEVDRKRGFLDSLNYNNPSPADYLSQGYIDCKGHFIPITKRFVSGRDATPGPGTYWIHPYFENSVHKAFTTHNSKIKKDMVKNMLKYQAEDASEIGDPKKQRKMRWFVNEGKGYSHCV